jgi:hypothetical protein
MEAPHNTHTHTVNDDDLWISDPAKIAKVYQFESDPEFKYIGLNQIRNSRSTTACSGGVDLAPTQPFEKSHGREMWKREEAHGGKERSGAWRKGEESFSKDLPLSVETVA